MVLLLADMGAGNRSTVSAKCSILCLDRRGAAAAPRRLGLAKLEQRGARLALAEVELERLARAGVALGRGPIELIVAVAQVLQARAARRVLLDLVGGRAGAAR